LDFKDERQMKIVKPTHCSYTTDEQRLFESITLGHHTLDFYKGSAWSRWTRIDPTFRAVYMCYVVSGNRVLGLMVAAGSGKRVP
jgi:hypothetical protein